MRTTSQTLDPDKPKKVFKGIWIAKAIWEFKGITCGERCLLAEIENLDEGDGCYASNKYFAMRFDTTEIAIAAALSRLRKLGWIVDRKFDGRLRWISIQVGKGRPKHRKKAGLLNSQPSEAPHIDQESTVENTVLPEPIAQMPSEPLQSSSKKTPDPNHKIFVDLWVERYFQKFQRKYVFQGGQDAKAVQRLLTASGETPQALIAIAEMAWNKPNAFFCGKAVSISFFVSQFNQIRAEIDKAAAPVVPKEAQLWQQVRDCEEELKEAKDAIYYTHDQTPEKLDRYYALRDKLKLLKSRQSNEQPRR